jgi:sigma-E factor negative regulatory protein RseB
MRKLVAILAICSLAWVSNAAANDVVSAEAKAWLEKLKSALNQQNFDAGVVVMKSGKTDSFRWIHGVDKDGTEIETLNHLIGGAASTIRVNDQVTFIEPNKEAYSVRRSHIEHFVPDVFYRDFLSLADSYQFVVVGKNKIAGRVAQLIRLESRQNTSFNYWLWLDEQTGLPLRLAFVDHQGEVVQQTLMTHLMVTPDLPDELDKVKALVLPEPIDEPIASTQKMNSWLLKWLPPGFELKKSDRHRISISREASDYFLFSDGLVDFSVYIQRPLESFNSPVILQDGATSFVMVRSNGFDVTIVGDIPKETGYQIASNVVSRSNG